MKIEDLRINQKVWLVTTMRDWGNVGIVTIVGLNIDRDGIENITIDDGEGCRYDGWKLRHILPLE